jgi:hypothetical protein
MTQHTLNLIFGIAVGWALRGLYGYLKSTIGVQLDYELQLIKEKIKGKKNEKE